MSEKNMIDQDTTIAALEALIGVEHISGDYVRFRIDLLKAQHATLEEVVSNEFDGEEAIPLDRVTGELGRVVTVPRLTSLWSGILKACHTHGQGGDDLKQFDKVMRDEPEVVSGLLHSMIDERAEIAPSAMGSSTGVSVEALLFALRAILAPFAAAVASRVDKEEADAAMTVDSDSGACGICNSATGLSYLEGEEGQRTLCCSLCGWQRRFSRLGCPYCGNREQDSLANITIEEDPLRWIEVCEECRGYVKVVDTRKMGANKVVIPLVEEVSTMHLDLMGEGEGYKRKVAYVALV